MLCGFITIWFTVGCRVALEVGFCTLFKVVCLRKCNVFSGWGNAVFSEKMVWYSKPIIYLAHRGNKFTSGLVNELFAKKDRIIERQSTDEQSSFE